LLLWAAAVLPVPAALAATPAELLAGYSAQARVPPSPERGEKMFNTNFGRELGLSCSSCHGAVPTKRGKDEVTGKAINPLAPAANPARFTDKSKVDYAFQMNCRDVVGRECTAAEKADVLSWLISLKP
jgi:hypothetical protein